MTWRHTPLAAGLVTLLASANGGAQSPASGAAAFTLPKPTGPFSVGTTSFQLSDEARRDPLAGGPGPRQVGVVAWYPAVNGAAGERAPYLRAGAAEARTFASLMRQPENAFDYLHDTQTHAVLDAPPRTGELLPLLLFSHGYTAIASSYTALLEDLASHGFAVLTIVHPYEAMAATLAEGRIVTLLDEKKQMRKPIRDVFGEWGKEDETMAAVTSAKDDNEKERLMREFLGTLPRTTEALDRWVADTALVLDRLPTLPAGPGARLAARVERAKVGAFGHSMGGVTSADFCSRDYRCRAALNLDGIPQYGTLIDAPASRPFLMVYSGRQGRLGASDVIYRRATRPYRRVDVADTLHNDFSDMVLWGGPLNARPMFGKRPGEQTLAVTRQIVREFFDQELRGRRSPLLNGSADVAGIRVH